jgi:small subunit ribosomal protein S17
MDMADETPDTPQPEETPAAQAPEAPAEETPEATEPEAAASAPEPEAAPAPKPAAPKPEPVAQLTPGERKIASRQRRGKRRPSTPEERIELRKAKAVARSRRRASEKAKKAAAPDGEGTPRPEREPGNPKIRLGKVVSAKADKTITVKIDTARRHRKYQKIVRSSTTLHAHDETNDANEGDLVRVIESRPMSATKRWRLTDVLERAK